MKHQETSLDRYYRHGRAQRLGLFGVLTLLIITILISLSIGSITITTKQILTSLFTLNRSGEGRIVWDVRLVRVLAAVLVGGSLSLAGTMMQSVLRNPLASPYTLGLSSAAAFGASVAIVFFGSGTSTTSTIIVTNAFTTASFAFLFSIISTLAILGLTVTTTISAQSMVLAGIAISSIFSAGLTLMQYLANSVQLAAIVSWTFGDLGRATWKSVGSVAVTLLPTLFIALLLRWDFNAMESGEESAKGLGVRVGLVRIGGMIAASLLAAVVVSFFGTIAFIGLLGPHIAKRIFGGDHRHLLIASPLIGATVLLTADPLARTILLPMVLPVGTLTSLLGGPLFISLLLGGKKR